MPYNTKICRRYIVFAIKAHRAKKQSVEAENKQAKDDDKDFEEPRKSIDMDYISTQDMRSKLYSAISNIERFLTVIRSSAGYQKRTREYEHATQVNGVLGPVLD